MDILPPDAVVWIDGERAPQVVSQLRQEQNVICVDSHSMCVRYAEALSFQDGNDLVDSSVPGGHFSITVQRPDRNANLVALVAASPSQGPDDSVSASTLADDDGQEHLGRAGMLLTAPSASTAARSRRPLPWPPPADKPLRSRGGTRSW